MNDELDSVCFVIHIGCMTKQTPFEGATSAEKRAELVATEIRVEMYRQGKTNRDLAAVLNVTEQTAGRRAAGKIPFTTIDLAIIEMWLEVDIETIYARASRSERPVKAAA